MEVIKVIKEGILFRLFTWGIGTMLSLVSRFVFLNDNDLIWNIAMYYNEIVCILSCIPIVQIMLVVDLIRSKEQIMNHILTMAIVLICFFIYIGVWVSCTGGV